MDDSERPVQAGKRTVPLASVDDFVLTELNDFKHARVCFVKADVAHDCKTPDSMFVAYAYAADPVAISRPRVPESAHSKGQWLRSLAKCGIAHAPAAVWVVMTISQTESLVGLSAGCMCALQRAERDERACEQAALHAGMSPHPRLGCGWQGAKCDWTCGRSAGCGPDVDPSPHAAHISLAFCT